MSVSNIVSVITVVICVVSSILSSDLTEHQEDFNEIIKIAEDISNMFPNSRVYSLGQSLAWITEALKIMNSFRPTGSTFQHVPFSKNFLTDCESDSEDTDDDAYFRTPGFFTCRSRDMPSYEEQQNYRLLLQNLGLDPENILTQYIESSHQTVIVDYINSGCGIASFLYFLLKWAEEKKVDLRPALRVVVLANEWSSGVESLDINDSEFVVNLIIMHRYESVLKELVNTEVYNSDFVRLVPYYPADHWNEQPVDFDEEHKRRIDEMMNKLREYLEGYYRTLATPTLVLRTSEDDVDLPPISLEIPTTSLDAGFCSTHGNRLKRQAGTGRNSWKDNPFYLIFTLNTEGFLNRKVCESLRLECTECLSDSSFIKFVEKELKNPYSTASKILELACRQKTKIADGYQFDRTEEDFEIGSLLKSVINMVLHLKCT